LGNVALEEFVRSGYQPPDRLNEAIRHYELARRAALQPKNAQVPAKVRVSLARVFSTVAQSGKPEHFADVERELSPVIQEFESGNQSIAALASHAYFYMGVVRERRDDDRRAAADYYCRCKLLAGSNNELANLAQLRYEAVSAGFDPRPECTAMRR
jgi:hypothetical protein